MQKFKLFFIFIVIASLIMCGCDGGGVLPPDTSSDDDALLIKSAANQIEIAIEEKDKSMFMELIAEDYEDEQDRDYQDIENMIDDIITQLEEIEQKAGLYNVTLTVNVSMDNLNISDMVATAQINVTINAKVLFVPVYSYEMVFDTDFEEYNNLWQITALLETELVDN